MRVLILVLAVGAALPLWAGSVTLRPEAETAGPYVRLGEVAEIQGDPVWSDIFLGPAPAAGEPGRVTRAEVARRLAYLGVPAEVGGAEATVLRLASPSAAAGRMARDVREEVARRLEAMPAGDGAHWRLSGVLPPLPTGWEAAEVESVSVPGPQGGEVEVALAGRLPGGRREGTTLTATVFKARRVVVAVRPLRSNQVLVEGDVAERELPVAKVPAGALESAREGLGSLVLRPVEAEGILVAAALAAPRLVTRGSVCVLSEPSGRVRVRCQGKALADGARGELVAFEIMDSRKTVRARVRAAGEADLCLEEVPCGR